MNRRRFLGAAAALSGVASTASASSTDNHSETEDENREPFLGGPTKILQTAGGYEAIDGQNRTTRVNLSKHSEAATLSLANDFGSMDAMLLPEDIDSLIVELQDAKARINSQDAAEAREWVTKQHKETHQ